MYLVVHRIHQLLRLVPRSVVEFPTLKNEGQGFLQRVHFQLTRQYSTGKLLTGPVIFRFFMFESYATSHGRIIIQERDSVHIGLLVR